MGTWSNTQLFSMKRDWSKLYWWTWNLRHNVNYAEDDAALYSSRYLTSLFLLWYQSMSLLKTFFVLVTHQNMMVKFWLRDINYLIMSSQSEGEDDVEGILCDADALLYFVSGHRKESCLYQLWTLILQTVHHLILGAVRLFRKLLSPVWRTIQNKTWTADKKSDQHCTK